MAALRVCRQERDSQLVQVTGQIVQQRLENEQLRREASMKRIPVSQAVEDIKVIQG